ncbi:MAG: hypothetical protein ACRDPE_00825 [Solirubrobacterales bacterium]
MAVDIWILRVAAEPIDPYAAIGAEFGLEAELGDALALLEGKAGEHPRLLGTVETLEADLQHQLVAQSGASSIVREVLFAEPAASTRRVIGFDDGSQGVDQIALSRVVLADDHGQWGRKTVGPVQIAIALGRQCGDLHPRRLLLFALSAWRRDLRDMRVFDSSMSRGQRIHIRTYITPN